jgi:hypothetical protein
MAIVVSSFLSLPRVSIPTVVFTYSTRTSTGEKAKVNEEKGYLLPEGTTDS